MASSRSPRTSVVPVPEQTDNNENVSPLIRGELDYDPAAVPVSPAATVMLIDDRPDLHVLMVHRTAKVVFAPDSWVFPGGRVDPEDHLDDFDRLFRGLTDDEASAILDVDRGGLAWWLAACRETLEESGLLLAADGVTVEADVASDLRHRLEADETLFADLLLERGITLDATLVEEVARFITPMGPPRRFDARFFVARAPAGQEASHDFGEIVNTEWIRPTEVLERWQAGEMEMMSPTTRMVACLARHSSADQVMDLAKRRLAYQRVRVADPYGNYEVLLPGEEGYEQAELEVESGWVRLWNPELS